MFVTLSNSVYRKALSINSFCFQVFQHFLIFLVFPLYARELELHYTSLALHIVSERFIWSLLLLNIFKPVLISRFVSFNFVSVMFSRRIPGFPPARHSSDSMQLSERYNSTLLSFYFWLFRNVYWHCYDFIHLAFPPIHPLILVTFKSLQTQIFCVHIYNGSFPFHLYRIYFQKQPQIGCFWK